MQYLKLQMYSSAFSPQCTEPLGFIYPSCGLDDRLYDDLWTPGLYDPTHQILINRISPAHEVRGMQYHLAELTVAKWCRKWTFRDSNPVPAGYEPAALTN